MSSSHFPWVINFANSVVGVGVLAIPFCFHKCGIIMATMLILATNYCSKATCDFLLRAAQKQRTSGFENLALIVIGPIGKLLTELCTIGLLLGTLVAFQVVLGDLAPTIVHNVFGVEESWNLRAFLMFLSCLAIIPLSLMRNISSLAGMNAMSMGFYSFFVILIGALSIGKVLSLQWWSQVTFWQSAGFFHCLPIISLAFSCQTQVFVMYEALPDASVNAMNEIIDKAINLVTTIYISVGFLGYIAFYNEGIRGDILANFPSGLMTDGIKAGFWLSVVISFPLIIFPVRLALYSLLFGRKKNSDVISSASDYIPQGHFTVITLVLVGGTLIVGITIPHIETVLSVTGACIGTFLCFVLPCALYLLSVDSNDRSRVIARVILGISLFCMVASTVTVLSGPGSESSTEVHKLVAVPVVRSAPAAPVVKKQVPKVAIVNQQSLSNTERPIQLLNSVVKHPTVDNVVSEKEKTLESPPTHVKLPVNKVVDEKDTGFVKLPPAKGANIKRDILNPENFLSKRKDAMLQNFDSAYMRRKVKTVEEKPRNVDNHLSIRPIESNSPTLPVIKKKSNVNLKGLDNMIRAKHSVDLSAQSNSADDVTLTKGSLGTSKPKPNPIVADKSQ